MNTYTPDEVIGFVEASKMLAEGMKGLQGVSFYRGSILKSVDIIEYLVSVLQGQFAASGLDQLQKEKMEGEKEKRELPPTPPIESKAKEGGEKKDPTPSACVRVCEGAGARTCEDVPASEGMSEAEKKARRESRRLNAEADEVFEAFWSKYPSGYKVAKTKCRKKVRIRYRDAKDKAQFVNEFLGGLDNWLGCQRWAEGLICNPETWINQERWLVEVKKSSSAIEEEKRAKKKAEDEEAAATLRKMGL